MLIEPDQIRFQPQYERKLGLRYVIYVRITSGRKREQSLPTFFMDLLNDRNS